MAWCRHWHTQALTGAGDPSQGQGDRQVRPRRPGDARRHLHRQPGGRREVLQRRHRAVPELRAHRRGVPGDRRVRARPSAQAAGGAGGGLAALPPCSMRRSSGSAGGASGWSSRSRAPALIRFSRGVTLEPELARDFAAKHGLAIGTSFEEVLADPAIQAVALATPHTRHRAQVEAAAAAGKHVYCEKPFALSRADAQAMLDACARAGVTIAVGHHFRLMPSMKALRREVASGGLGTIMHVEGNYSHDWLKDLPADSWRGGAGGIARRRHDRHGHPPARLLPRPGRADAADQRAVDPPRAGAADRRHHRGADRVRERRDRHARHHAQDAVRVAARGLRRARLGGERERDAARRLPRRRRAGGDGFHAGQSPRRERRGVRGRRARAATNSRSMRPASCRPSRRSTRSSARSRPTAPGRRCDGRPSVCPAEPKGRRYSPFPTSLWFIVLFTRQCVPSPGSSVRRGRLRSTFIPISGVRHAVEGVDDGLLLLMIERVGLAAHHILEDQRLRLGDESKIRPIGQGSCRTALIGLRPGNLDACRFSRERIGVARPRLRHHAIVVDGNIRPVRRGEIGLEAFGQIFVALIRMPRLPWGPAAEDIGALVHRRQYRRPGQIQIGRRRIGSIVGVGRARIIDGLGRELVQLVLRRDRYPIRDGVDLVHRGPDAKLVERRLIENSRLWNSGLLLKRQHCRSCAAARNPVQGTGIDAEGGEFRLGLLRHRVVGGCSSGLRQSQSHCHHQTGQHSPPHRTCHDVASP